MSSRSIARRLFQSGVALAFLLLGSAGAYAQSDFGTQAIGATSSQTVTVTAQAAGTVSQVQVLTMGTAGLDFAGSGGTCASASLTANQQCSLSVSFTPRFAGTRMGAVVLLDSGSHVLGTAYLKGIGKGGLAVLAPGNMVPYAGSGAWDFVDDGLPATQADLNLPSAVALDGAGNLYIADSVHNRIRRVDVQTQIITTVAGSGNSGFSPDGTKAVSADLNSPSGVALDSAGNLYIADTGNNAVREVSVATGQIFTIAGGGAASYSGDNGPATAAKLNQPWGVTLDGAGNIYIADTANHRIRKVTAATGIITTVAGTGFTYPSGMGAYNGDGGPAVAAELNRPYAVAFDTAGNMYIPDSGNARIRLVNLAGIISTVAGDGTAGSTGDGGPAVAAQLWAPSGVVVDPANNIYIADSQNNAIRKVNATTGTIATLVENYVGLNLVNGKLYSNALYGPIGLTLDGYGNLYVADYFLMRVRKIQANASVLDFTKTPTRQGDTSNPLNQTLENDGNADLTLNSIAADQDSTYDSATTTCNAGSALATDAACVIAAEFAPSQAGNPLFAKIGVDGVSVNSPLTINLVGDALAVNSTTVNLISSLNPAKFGQSITYTATVTTGAGTGSLTGTLDLLDGTTKIATGIALNASGVGTFTTNSLSVGAHSITAVYSGDAKHFSSSSTPVSQVVNEVTITTLASDANPAALGTTLTLTATVKISGGGGVTPTGTVTFLDGSTTLSTVALTPAGTAIYSTSTLPDGLHSITAVYSGDAVNYILASSSAALEEDVLAGSTVALSAGPNPSNYGTPVTFTAAVTSPSSSVAPTGVVNFLDNGAQIGTANLVGTTGVATFTTSSLTAGTHPITAVYKGSPNVGPGTSTVVAQTVNLTETSTALSAAPSPGIAGKPVTLSAKVAVIAGSATVTGTVTFTDGATTLGSAKLNASGVATLSPLLGPGTHSIMASYGGDTNDNPSASTAVPLTVVLATTKVVLTTSSTPAQVLSTVTFTAVVSGNGGIPSGAVTFLVDGASAGVASVDSTGTAKFSTKNLSVGTHTISASYGGDTNDNPSTSAGINEVIQAIPTVTDLGASATSGPLPQSILVATTLASTGPVPTGTITFNEGSKVIGSALLDSSGIATLMPDLPPGTYSIVANYSGDAIHSPSASAAVTIAGTPTGFGISVDPPTMTMVTTQNGTVNITLTSNNGFADTIGMGCLSLPAAVNCHFSKNSVALKSGQSQTVQLTIDTNAPLSGGTTASNARPSGTGMSLAGLFAPLGLLFGWIFWRFRKRNAAALVAALVLFLAGTLAVTGCGATFSQSSAAPGTYTIQVGGVGTSSNISHYQTVTLTITK